MKVLSNADAWELLVAKFRFHMTDDKYCLPGESQGFESIHEMRNDLCKYGIPGVGNSTTEEKRQSQDVGPFANVLGLHDGGTTKSLLTLMRETEKFM